MLTEFDNYLRVGLCRDGNSDRKELTIKIDSPILYIIIFFNIPQIYFSIGLLLEVLAIAICIILCIKLSIMRKHNKSK